MTNKATQPEQLSLDFSDYPAKEQEKDRAKHARLQCQDVYLTRQLGTWGAYLPRYRYPISINCLDKNTKLIEFVPEIKKIIQEQLGIKPRFHFVLNKGIEDYLTKQFIINNLFAGGRKNGR